jgi:hypothetical protein
MIPASVIYKPFRGALRPMQRVLLRRDTQCVSARLLSSVIAASDNPTWEEMDSKSRSLASLLLDDDDFRTDQKTDALEAARLRQSHIFSRRRGLSQAITMIESRKPEHQRQASLLLTYLLGHDDNHRRKDSSFRLGIAGSPGAGEFIFFVRFPFLMWWPLVNTMPDALNTICSSQYTIIIRQKHICGSFWKVPIERLPNGGNQT